MLAGVVLGPWTFIINLNECRNNRKFKLSDAETCSSGGEQTRGQTNFQSQVENAGLARTL